MTYYTIYLKYKITIYTTISCQETDELPYIVDIELCFPFL